jgi:hypothetical protein
LQEEIIMRNNEVSVPFSRGDLPNFRKYPKLPSMLMCKKTKALEISSTLIY